MATHSSILVSEIPWTEEPGGVQSMKPLRIRHYWATEHSHTRKPLRYCTAPQKSLRLRESCLVETSLRTYIVLQLSFSAWGITNFWSSQSFGIGLAGKFVQIFSIRTFWTNPIHPCQCRRLTLYIRSCLCWLSQIISDIPMRLFMCVSFRVWCVAQASNWELIRQEIKKGRKKFYLITCCVYDLITTLHMLCYLIFTCYFIFFPFHPINA